MFPGAILINLNDGGGGGGSDKGSYFILKEITTSEFVYPKKSLLLLFLSFSWLGTGSGFWGPSGTPHPKIWGVLPLELIPKILEIGGQKRVSETHFLMKCLHNISISIASEKGG